jgi:hypothetical protein
MRDETLLVLAGGALVLGLVIRHRISAAAGAAAPAGLKAGASAANPVAYSPVSTIAPPTPPLTPPGAPPAASTPPPAAVPPPATPAATAAASNAAYEAQEAQAHQAQQDYYESAVADFKARVDRGEVAPGSPYYDSTVAYLANIRGGVATAAEERAKLRAAGLAGRRRLH